MVHVETVDLSARGVELPSDRVGMVIAQPYLSLTAAEPYQCTSETKSRQLQMLTDTLKVSRAAQHGSPKTHFTIFPEYSIPGPDGIALVETALRADDWPAGTMVIGGADALSKPDFVTLASAAGTHLDTTHNSLARIDQNEWINCGVTWVKAADRTVERWLQPKLFPAWEEQNIPYQGMFRGNSVFTFKGPLNNGTQYHFCSLVCFDWVANLGSKKAWRWVLEGLGLQVAPAELSLSWFFVIQCNKKPSHDTFLTEVSGFFDQNVIPNVHRDRTCLVFANSAGEPVPRRTDQFGNTGLVFSPQTLFAEPKCHPTFCNGGSRFRSSTLLSAYHDVLFRERGACIHSFAQVNAGSLTAGAAGRQIAVDNPFVFPLAGATDPRAPSAPVPACVKWLNDELDHLPSLSTTYHTALLVTEVDTAHQLNIAGLRKLSPQSTTHTVMLAAQESKTDNADDWDGTESEACVHLVHTLDIVGVGFPPPTVGADPAHAAVLINNKTVDLLAIRGASHEGCIEHSKRFLSNPQRQVLLVSRDRDNTTWHKRFGSFLQPETPRLGQERNITDLASGSLHLGYQRLLDIFRQSATAAAIEGGINAELAA